LEDEIFIRTFRLGEKATQARNRVSRDAPKAIPTGSDRRASIMRLTDMSS
jgi:hypothetical protein